MKILFRGKRGELIGFIAVLALVIGAYAIIKSKGYSLNSPGEALLFARDFGQWIFQIGKNSARVIGFAVKQRWAPEGVNLTNITRNITAGIN